MPYFESDMPTETMRKHEQTSVCAECGSNLVICWGGHYGKNEYMLRCTRTATHQGTMKPHTLNYQNLPGFSLYPLSKRRRSELAKQLGEEKTQALMPYAQRVLTQETAELVVRTIWPNAPKADILKAAMICSQYELNPLMKHVFLIKFDRYEKGADGIRRKVGEDWAAVLGIQATRLIAHRAGDFSYVDDTPRVMSKAEQETVFGEVFADRIWAITKLRDAKGNEAAGYGCWQKADGVYGTEKGNTRQNMAFIRSERQALDRLFAGKMPSIEVVDERYIASNGREIDVATGEITDGKETAVIATSEQAPTGQEAKQEAKAGDTPEQASEAPAWSADDVKPDTEPQKASLIDLAWLKESLATLQAKGLKNWSNANLQTRLDRITGWESHSVSEAVSKLNQEQAVGLVAQIRESLGRS